jgi:hypothetical protein
MIRGSSIVLGVGMIVLWLVGLVHHATPWLTWLTAVGAVAAFGIAAGITPDRRGLALPVGAPIGLSIALFLLWIVGVSSGATAWMAWCVFAFGVAFTALGLLAIGERTSSTTPTMTHPRTV